MHTPVKRAANDIFLYVTIIVNKLHADFIVEIDGGHIQESGKSGRWKWLISL